MRKFLASLLLLTTLAVPSGAYAFDLFPKDVCGNAPDSAVCKDAKNNATENPVAKIIGSAARIIAIFVGVVAVIAIILGGFWYITSGGDSGKITKARTTILYALVGVVVTTLASAIVIFFTDRLLK